MSVFWDNVVPVEGVAEGPPSAPQHLIRSEYTHSVIMALEEDQLRPKNGSGLESAVSNPFKGLILHSLRLLLFQPETP